MGLETAAVLGIGKAVGAIGGAVGSFAQAGKQKRRQMDAERAAAKSMAEAKSKLNENFYEGLSVQKEPYELEREASLAGLGQIVQAGQAGERGVGAIAGRAALYNQNQQAQTRTAMGNEMQNLDKLVADEDARLNNAKINLDLAEAQGQQQIAADARASRSAALQQGVGGLGNALTAGLTVPGLYGAGDGGADVFNSVTQRQIPKGFAALTDKGIQGLGTFKSIINPETTNLFGVNTNTITPSVGLPNTWQEFNSKPN